MDSKLYIDLKEGLKRAREKKGWSQRKLADEMKVHIKTIQNWEQGVAKPEVNSLFKLKKIYGCDMAYLFGEIEGRTHDNNFIMEKTGLKEEAIEQLAEYRRSDQIREKGYAKLEIASEKKNAIPNRPRPISKAEIVSEMITHEKFPTVCSTLEAIASELPNDAKGIYPDSSELHDYNTYLLTKNIEAILLDCIDSLIEE